MADPLELQIGKLLEQARLGSAALCIGYCFSQQKAEKMGWSEVVAYCKSKNVDLVHLPLGISADLERCSVVVQKLTDELTALAAHDNGAVAALAVNTHGEVHEVSGLRDKLQEWETAIARLRIAQVDPVAAQRRTIDRAAFNAALASVRFPGRLRLARSVVLQSADEALPFPFPVICKTLRACGTSSAHEMAICFEHKELGQLEGYPLLAQEYAQHDGIIYKAFVVGSALQVLPRPSLANCSGPGPLRFHSQRPLPPALAPSALSATQQLPLDLDAAADGGGLGLPTGVEMRGAAAAVSAGLGLSLFGFDVVRASGGDALLLVDVNYLPGYRGFPRFPAHLLRHALQTHVAALAAHPPPATHSHPQHQPHSHVASHAAHHTSGEHPHDHRTP